MRFIAVVAIFFVAVFAHSAFARPDPAESPLHPIDPGTSSANFAPSLNKTQVDTTYILGGPHRWDGSFETPDGQADWHGWTHHDGNGSAENHWHVSTYWAENLAGHGFGNHALYNGDETIPACSANDTIGGYGNSWFDDIEWSQAVDDSSQPVTVRLTGIMTYDLTDEGWDFLELFVVREGFSDMLGSWTGTIDTTYTIDFTTVVSPSEFTGPGGNEVRLRWRVWSDGAWSDEDCLVEGHGACQIDDLSVYFDGQLITFDDFEPGSPVNWNVTPFLGVGDFTNLRNDLGDIDPCRDNHTWQVNFIDDGMVVPELDGTPCLDWCYDPGGWILNNTGGLLADDEREWFLDNRVTSPPIAYPADQDGAELLFDVYRHDTFGQTDDAGMFYTWGVRSTDSSDPADLEFAPWKSRNFLYHGGPDFKRHEEMVWDLLVPDRQWIQIELAVVEMGWIWGVNGPNGTPAPYFDNVAFKVWDPMGPEISIHGSDFFGDGTPSAGFLNPDDLAANSCRVDAAGTTYFEDRGDTIVVKVKPIRHDAVVITNPVLHWVMECNPLFDSVRSGNPTGGILRGLTTGTETVDQNGYPVADHWTFDLPDEGFFFPGDRLRYYIVASDDLAGDVRASVFPPDTTGITDFSLGSSFTRRMEIWGLPSVTQPTTGQFEQPSLIFCDDTDDPAAAEVWFDALAEQGLERGVHYDIVTMTRLNRAIRLDKTVPIGLLAGYQTLVLALEDKMGGYLLDEDAFLLETWLDLGGKQLLTAGDDVGQVLSRSGPPSYLGNRLGSHLEARYIYELNGDQRDLQISPTPGAGVLPDHLQWQVYDGCPTVRFSNAITPTGEGLASATLDPEGNPSGPYAALVTVDDPVLDNRTIVMPFGVDRVDGLTSSMGPAPQAMSPRAYLLNYLLFWLGSDALASAPDVPGPGQVAVAVHPNPFNPQTTIAFDLPRAMEVSLDIFDLQGRHVRSLLRDDRHDSGSHHQVWDGRNASGQNTASGVYFFRLQAGQENRVGKLTLLK